ncbi:hypothetical protein BKA59DRAFT_460104 [Fusarium tricinctum]|uniref:DUF676 domain-containing protein n=1 Tax=Fusarium tricinctum TaxID=61284 RepID=A0A8K0W7B5_9HYPO|nr:hypothetical protein BKA59DRAFT_460104 [Fusarium tricinctum]
MHVQNDVTDKPSQPVTLSLDQEFLGITTLFAPGDDDHKLDIIALAGLGGHAFGSFKERDGEHMWLRDDLPYDLTPLSNERPMARIMTYGYKSVVVNSTSCQNFEDIATQLIASLRSLAEGPTTRPIVFIAHSLGGIIVKQALIILAKSKLVEDSKLLQAVYGIAFFGVPHLGMDIGSLVAMTGNAPSRSMVKSLSRDKSQILSSLQWEIVDVLGPEGKSEVVCFYEDSMSPTPVQDDKGKWKMNGPLAVLVSKPSATQCRPWENGPEHICALSRPHSEMVKFAENHHEYDKVRIALRGLAQRAVKGYRGRIGSDTKFIVPYIRNDDFVGRTKVLQELQKQHNFDKRSVPVKAGHRVYFYGLGGVGNAEQFRRSFLDIAQKCQIPDHDKPEADVLTLVKHWLEDEQRGHWLMVIDNADDMTMFLQPSESVTSSGITMTTQQGFASYLPNTAKGVILITTRNKKLGVKLTRGKGHCDVKIDRMQDDESQVLLRQKLPEQDYPVEQLLALASRLEYLPLALVQAAAFMKTQSMSISRYLDHLNTDDKHLVRLLSQGFEPDEPTTITPIAVTETLIIRFEMIEAHSEADINFECALGTLKAFSLMSEAKTGSLSMHRLVQLVTRKWLNRKQKLSFYATQSLLIISNNYPKGTFENRTTCTAYLPHATMVLGDEHRKTLKSMSDLVAIEWSLSAYEEVKKLAIPLVETLQRVFGKEDRLTLTAMNALALIHYSQGNLDEAQRLFERMMQTQKRVYGYEHHETLSTGNNLAAVYRGLKLVDEAQRLHLLIVAGRKRVLGRKHPSTLTSMVNLATTYYDQKRLDKSEEIIKETRKIQEDLLGKKHPATLWTESSLATIWYESGRRQEAVELMEYCIEGRREALGRDHNVILAAERELRMWKEEILNDS